jgi:hypothetical protein
MEKSEATVKPSRNAKAVTIKCTNYPYFVSLVMTGKVARLESKTSLGRKEKPKTCLGLLIPVNIKWADYSYE